MSNRAKLVLRYYIVVCLEDGAIVTKSGDSFYFGDELCNVYIILIDKLIEDIEKSYEQKVLVIEDLSITLDGYEKL